MQHPQITNKTQKQMEDKCVKSKTDNSQVKKQCVKCKRWTNYLDGTTCFICNYGNGAVGLHHSLNMALMFHPHNGRSGFHEYETNELQELYCKMNEIVVYPSALACTFLE